MYVKDVSSGTTLSNCEPIIIKENAATAYVDGKNLLGPVVGSFSMKIAIKKAFSSGIGFVVANSMSTWLQDIHLSSNFVEFFYLLACGILIIVSINWFA